MLLAIHFGRIIVKLLECLLVNSLEALPVLLIVKVYVVHVVLKVKLAHRPQNVVSHDRLPLLLFYDLARLTRNEGDELSHALLHALAGLTAHFGVLGQCFFHDAVDVGDRQEAVLVLPRVFHRSGVEVRFESVSHFKPQYCVYFKSIHTQSASMSAGSSLFSAVL